MPRSGPKQQVADNRDGPGCSYFVDPMQNHRVQRIFGSIADAPNADKRNVQRQRGGSDDGLFHIDGCCPGMSEEHFLLFGRADQFGTGMNRRAAQWTGAPRECGVAVDDDIADPQRRVQRAPETGENDAAERCKRVKIGQANGSNADHRELDFAGFPAGNRGLNSVGFVAQCREDQDVVICHAAIIVTERPGS